MMLDKYYYTGAAVHVFVMENQVLATTGDKCELNRLPLWQIQLFHIQ